jgi:hypothetical protein
MNKSFLLYDEENYDDNDDEDDYVSVKMSSKVKAFLKHLTLQQSWSDVEWLPGDIVC